MPQRKPPLRRADHELARQLITAGVTSGVVVLRPKGKSHAARVARAYDLQLRRAEEMHRRYWKR